MQTFYKSMPKISPLPDAELQSRLSEVPAWQLADNKLHRRFVFPDFVTAFGFMTGVAMAAEVCEHHPSWRNTYNRVDIELWTHDADGITALDFKLAKKIDALAVKFGAK